MAVGDARDLRQVRDREHLRTLGETGRASRPRDAPCRRRCRRRSRRRRASRRRRRRRSRAPRATARRLTPSRRPGRTEARGWAGSGRRPRPRPAGPGSRSAQLDVELALAHADAAQLRGDGVGERPLQPRVRASLQLGGERARSAPRACGHARRRPPRAGRGPRPAPRARPRPRRGARAAPRAWRSGSAASQSAIRSSRCLDRLEALRLGLERRDEPVQVAADLAQPQRRRRGAPLPAASSSGAIARAARAHARAAATSAAAPSPSSGAIARRPPPRRPRRARRRDAGARARRAARSSSSASMPSVSSTSASQLRDAARPPHRRRARARRGADAPPPALARRYAPRGGAELLGAAERVEDVELVRRAREPPLLELAGHRDQSLRRRREILARDRPAPRVRPRSPVGEDAAREHEPGLVLRPQLGEGLELVVLEEPVRQRRARPRRTPRSPARTDRGRIAAWRRAAARSPARRSSCPLPSRRVSAFRPAASSSSAVADQDEVLDAEPTKQSSSGTGGRTSPRGASPSSERSGPEPHRRPARPALPSPTRGRRRGRRQERRGVRFQTIDVAAAGHDERPRVERVRRDERDRHRVDPPHQHRAAVREVVGGRAGRRRADQAVARLAAELLAADRPLELDHPAERRRSSTTASLTATRRCAADLDLERRQLDDVVLAGEHPRQPGLQLVARDRAEEADPAEVDADHRARPCRGTASSARSIVPSPPSTIATSASSRRRSRRRSRASSPPRPRRASSTPASRATASQPRERRADLVRLAVRDHGRPRFTALSRRRRRSSGRRHRVLPAPRCRIEVDEELPVSLRARKTRVYDADHARIPRRRGLGHVSQARADAPRGRGRRPSGRLGAPGLELRLDEHERLPAGRGEPRAPAAAPSVTEMNDTSQVTSSGANGSSVSVAHVRRARAR